MPYYDLLQGSEIVGNIQVQRKGLYLCFECVCHITGEIMYDLMLQTEQSTLNLGLLAPVPGGFGLRKSVKEKTVGQGSYRFFLNPRHECVSNTFYPVQAEAPFAYLSRLESAYLVRRGDRVGLSFAPKNNAEIM